MLTQEKQEQQTQTIIAERAINASPAEIYRAFTKSHALRDWLCNGADVDPHRGGHIYLWWNDGYYVAGKFTELIPNKRIACTSSDTYTASDVVVEIEANDGNNSIVSVTQTALNSGEEWAERTKRKRNWEETLESLQSILETGVDLRLARRPMFGLSGADVLDANIAKELKVPVNEGLRITGLIDGLGAQNAGIQKDDVIVSLGGYPLDTFTSIGTALQHFKAGDTVNVEFYRDGEKRTLPLTLSARPSAQLPESAQALAKQMREMHAALDAELDALFQGVTEAQADSRPGPNDWNAKEILAHLVATERDAQVWATIITEDADPQQVFHSNENVRVRAIVAMNPTAREMVDALKRAEAETAAVIESLPPQAAARKHLFQPLATWLTTFDAHHREHFALIKTMLESASD